MRQRELLEERSAGETRMRRFGKTEIPQSADIEALRMEERRDLPFAGR